MGRKRRRHRKKYWQGNPIAAPALPANTAQSTTTVISRVYCTHWRAPVALKDGLSITASSWVDRPKTPAFGWCVKREDSPDLGIYLDSMWDTDTLMTTPGCDVPWAGRLKNTYDVVLWEWIDGSGPAYENIAIDGFRWALEQIKAGKKVDVGCVGGHGRTGTFIAAILILQGMPSWEAIDYVQDNYCVEAVESRRQEEFLQDVEFSITNTVKPRPAGKPSRIKGPIVYAGSSLYDDAGEKDWYYPNPHPPIASDVHYNTTPTGTCSRCGDPFYNYDSHNEWCKNASECPKCGKRVWSVSLHEKYCNARDSSVVPSPSGEKKDWKAYDDWEERVQSSIRDAKEEVSLYREYLESGKSDEMDFNDWLLLRKEEEYNEWWELNQDYLKGAGDVDNPQPDVVTIRKLVEGKEWGVLAMENDKYCAFPPCSHPQECNARDGDCIRAAIATAFDKQNYGDRRVVS